MTTTPSETDAGGAPHRVGHREPPRGLWATLACIGPGVILVGNVVGSGELIATPNFALRAGFACLWLVLVSCVVKVFLQVEMGRFAIGTGKTSLQGFDELPGPRWRVNWFLWAWLVMFVGTQFQVGGMISLVGQAADLTVPLFEGRAGLPGGFGLTSVDIWSTATAISCVTLLLLADYGLVERFTLALVVAFTAVTIAVFCLLQTTPLAVTGADIREGLRFSIPAGSWSAAIAAFGITGVGASELVMYPYWCLEKGYARWAGSDRSDPAWPERARAWLRVMHLDAWSAMLLFTLSTVIFYLLGAALLAGNVSPDAKLGIVELSGLFPSEVFGRLARPLFLIGAVCVCYSTFFVATAANARLIVDFLGLAGWLDLERPGGRDRAVRVASVLLPALGVALAWVWADPAVMVTIGGVLQALMLPAIGGATLYFAHRRTHPALRPPAAWLGVLWLVAILLAVLMSAFVYVQYLSPLLSAS